MNENSNVKKQLEMGLNANGRPVCRRRGHQRQKRAQWWFQQMRGLVDSAVDWKPAPENPEQAILGLSRKEQA